MGRGRYVVEGAAAFDGGSSSEVWALRRIADEEPFVAKVLKLGWDLRAVRNELEATQLLGRDDREELFVEPVSYGPEPEFENRYVLILPWRTPLRLAFADPGHAGLERLDYWSEIGRRARWIADLAVALDVLHACGRLHRDVHLNNAFVGADGRALLGDLGTTGPPWQTPIHGPVGHPSSCAPGPWKSGIFLPADDRYSLGHLAWWLLTGHAPLLRTSRDAAVPPTPVTTWTAPSRQDPLLPVELDGVLARACAWEADDRYPTARAMSSDIAAALGVNVAAAHDRSEHLATEILRFREATSVHFGAAWEHTEDSAPSDAGSDRLAGLVGEFERQEKQLIDIRQGVARVEARVVELQQLAAGARTGEDVLVAAGKQQEQLRALQDALSEFGEHFPSAVADARGSATEAAEATADVDSSPGAQVGSRWTWLRARALEAQPDPPNDVAGLQAHLDQVQATVHAIIERRGATDTSNTAGSEPSAETVPAVPRPSNRRGRFVAAGALALFVAGFGAETLYGGGSRAPGSPTISVPGTDSSATHPPTRTPATTVPSDSQPASSGAAVTAKVNRAQHAAWTANTHLDTFVHLRLDPLPLSCHFQSIPSYATARVNCRIDNGNWVTYTGFATLTAAARYYGTRRAETSSLSGVVASCDMGWTIWQRYSNQGHRFAHGAMAWRHSGDQASVLWTYEGRGIIAEAHGSVDRLPGLCYAWSKGT